MNILGIDYGTKKIGLAIFRSGFAAPLKILQNIPNHQVENQNILEITKIVNDENIEIIAIGLPLINGEETASTKIVREFANKLKAKTSQNKIQFVDESHTTNEAKNAAVEFNISKENRNEDDAFSAVKIIQRYLEETQKS